MTRFTPSYVEPVAAPRRRGHSAALLDYFFRGRLDVQPALDPDDPANPASVVLRGVNASSEPLIDGEIMLYADAQDGQRTAATPLGSTNVAGIAPGASLPTLRFQIPPGAERFMAVYQGTLGNEARGRVPRSRHR